MYHLHKRPQPSYRLSWTTHSKIRSMSPHVVQGLPSKHAFLILGSFSLLMTSYGNMKSLIGFFYINLHTIQPPHSSRMFVNVVTLFVSILFLRVRPHRQLWMIVFRKTFWICHILITTFITSFFSLHYIILL